MPKQQNGMNSSAKVLNPTANQTNSIVKTCNSIIACTHIKLD